MMMVVIIPVLFIKPLPCARHGTKCSTYRVLFKYNTYDHDLQGTKTSLTLPHYTLSFTHSSIIYSLHIPDKCHLASGILSYSPCQKCPLAPVLHIISPFLAFLFLLSITSSDSSLPSPTILSYITVHVHHSVHYVKLFVLYTCVLVYYLPVFPFCNLNSATTGTCLSYPHWSL